MDLTIFKSLAKQFNDNGFRLYMIGGTTRDYLLGLEVLDYDFVTDATPDDMKTFLTDADYHFERFGTIKVKVNGVKVDVTTLRVEGEYLDSRHPSFIKYVKTIDEDYIRRDFTINAIYIDENMNVIDPSNGCEDLRNKVIRFIGNPEKRIKEDPLRISRADRFKDKLGFEFEDSTKKYLEELRYLLNEINPEKLTMESKKVNK